MPTKNFVGFGFGPIQEGLMLYEAQQSGNFGSYTVAEIDQKLVEMVRANGNSATVNIATAEGIFAATLERVDLYNPTVPADRAALCRAIAQADEMATAVPSVKFYGTGGANAIASLLAENIDPGRQQILYASENNNYAAHLLEAEILRQADRSRLARFQILDTVIGKMSGVITDRATIDRFGLAPLTPSLDRAVLVEAFNRILISKIVLPGFQNGITVFTQKNDLLPFEEAKLFGHNAIHSLLGYLAFQRGYSVMSQARADGRLMALARTAFIDESGAALVRKHRALGDRLFSPAGYADYADGLLDRMTNPYLHDEVSRICRDPFRKLGFGDRFFGTMREALKQGIEPVILAQGAAAALGYYVMERSAVPKLPSLGADDVARLLKEEIWKAETLDSYADQCIELVQQAIDKG